jgi:serine/threonine-protein kinase RsbW
MADEPLTWKYERAIASDLAEGRQAAEQVLARLEENGWCERDRYAVRLALEEALVNAVIHGNQCHPDKRVGFRCELSEGWVRIEIADEGPGFDPDALPDPTTDDRLECPGGRGVMLMRHFMTRVEFSDHGRRVAMEKRRDADAPS